MRSQRGPLAPQRVVKILIQCCASLAEAHSIGIIHRDIKPDNVFLLNMAGSPDFVKLLDFSVAKLLEGDRMKTQAGVVFGTPQYMSPEQGRGLPLDARSDLYALGILAFEMLTGNVPFNDDNPMTVIQMHLHGAGAADAAIRSRTRCRQIVRRALEKDAGASLPVGRRDDAALPAGVRRAHAGRHVDRCRRRAADDDRRAVPGHAADGSPRQQCSSRCSRRSMQPPQSSPQQPARSAAAWPAAAAVATRRRRRSRRR